MKCAIQLVFDEINQEKINNIRRILQLNGVHDEAVPINHVSLADIEIEEDKIDVVKNILLDFAKTNKSLKFVLSSVGSFMTNENVLFLTPTITDELIKYNDEIVSLLNSRGIVCSKYYIKNNWHPHCTIAIRINDNELFKGFKILKNNNILPLEVVSDKIDLLCYDPKPYKELFCVNFQK